MEKEIKICDECNSEYYSVTSKMNQICPECSSVIYDYENCKHVLGENNRCFICYWDGSSSDYTKNIKEK